VTHIERNDQLFVTSLNEEGTKEKGKKERGKRLLPPPPKLNPGYATVTRMVLMVERQ